MSRNEGYKWTSTDITEILHAKISLVFISFLPICKQTLKKDILIFRVIFYTAYSLRPC
jgi:hypothetical protein